MHVQNTPCTPKTHSPQAGERTASQGQAAAAASRLGSSTHFATYREAIRAYPGPSYLVTLKAYGHNGGKAVLRTVHEAPRTTRKESTHPRRNTRGTPRSQADSLNLAKSAWRARSDIEDWLRMMATPGTDYRLVTGTRRNGFPTTRDAYQAVGKFRKHLARHYPDVHALAVPELHHGDGTNHGTYHVHMVLIFPPGQRPVYQVFHRIWKRCLGGTGAERGEASPGNLDFARTHAKDGTRYTPCQAARYLGKYVSKDLEAGNVGEKRFTTTHHAATPARMYYWQPIAANHQVTRAHMVQALRIFFPGDTHSIFSRTFHDGGDTYHVFSAEPVPRVQPPS